MKFTSAIIVCQRAEDIAMCQKGSSGCLGTSPTYRGPTWWHWPREQQPRCEPAHPSPGHCFEIWPLAPSPCLSYATPLLHSCLDLARPRLDPGSEVGTSDSLLTTGWTPGLAQADGHAQANPLSPTGLPSASGFTHCPGCSLACSLNLIIHLQSQHLQSLHNAF